MRKVSADWIYPVSSPPIKEGSLIFDDEGKLIDLLPNREGVQDLEIHSGILCPGFVNAHCHLELSHLLGAIPEGTGLPGFIGHVQKVRQSDAGTVLTAAKKADREMWGNGIVAVGDISNGSSSFGIKAVSEMSYHTFLELFGWDPDQADDHYQRGQSLAEAYRDEMEKNHRSSRVSLTPHAPYSVSEKLFKRIGEVCYTDGSPISLHNQESEAENEMFLSGGGELVDRLKKLGVNFDHWRAPGFRSLPATAIHLPVCNRIILVHNTYSNREDIIWAHRYSKVISWCLCPNANLYIEGKVPDLNLLRELEAHLVIGTDSLASNHQLSVWEEMRALHQQFPEVGFEEMLTWATLNGAEALGMKKELGSFQKEKRPGLVLIEAPAEDVFSAQRVTRLI